LHLYGCFLIDFHHLGVVFDTSGDLVVLVEGVFDVFQEERGFADA
jgi:hypothetical protein